MITIPPPAPFEAKVRLLPVTGPLIVSTPEAVTLRLLVTLDLARIRLPLPLLMVALLAAVMPIVPTLFSEVPVAVMSPLKVPSCRVGAATFPTKLTLPHAR